MDESWRAQIGTPSYRRRRHHHHILRSISPHLDTSATAASRRSLEEHLDLDDFSDVFGGPPRTVLFRKFSGDFTPAKVGSTPSFYEEVFWQGAAVGKKGGFGVGRSLPAFRIPASGEEGFYSDVFGVVEEEAEERGRYVGRMSRERSRGNSKGKTKSNSSSALSSEELSPLRQTVFRDDITLSSYTSKLRPIIVPCKWNSSTMKPDEQPGRKQGISSLQSDSSCLENETFRSCYFKVSRQVSSPESISHEPNSFRTIKVSVDELELNSPSSPASSLCQEPEVKSGAWCQNMEEDEDSELEEDEAKSYVIEINSDHREGTAEAVSVDEAIAWAKEKFQAQSCDRQNEKSPQAEAEEKPSTHESLEQQSKPQSPRSEMEVFDEDIRMWSAGKETNIQLLLSTLHHILWSDSGWNAVSLTNLIESSNVKKAYQKARLCLHPDKLQQRGATITQKYVAEKAFSILQEAWAAFLSQDSLS